MSRLVFTVFKISSINGLVSTKELNKINPKSAIIFIERAWELKKLPVNEAFLKVVLPRMFLISHHTAAYSGVLHCSWGS